MMTLPDSVWEPATVVTVPFAVESEGTDPPIAANAPCRTARACGSCWMDGSIDVGACWAPAGPALSSAPAKGRAVPLRVVTVLGVLACQAALACCVQLDAWAAAEVGQVEA